MGDARTERWVAHRAEVRERLIDSTMRAIDVIGPQVSIREIAAEAGIPKPYLYRFFRDKAELATAICDRLRDELHVRISTVPDPNITVGQFLRSCIEAYLNSVHAHPNIFRFVVLVTSESSGGTEAETARRATIAHDVTAVLTSGVSALGGTGNDLDLHAHMIVGTVISAASWWLDTGVTDVVLSRMLDNIEIQVRAMIQATAHANRVHIDFDSSMARLFNTVAAAAPTP